MLSITDRGPIPAGETNRALAWNDGSALMLLKLSNHIANSLGRAAKAEQRAISAENEATRSDNELIARNWRNLAKSYRLVESLGQFIDDRDRAKQEIEERLAQESKTCRGLAEKLAPGPERDALLKKAQRAETASEIEKWLSSPGSQPPPGFGQGS